MADSINISQRFASVVDRFYYAEAESIDFMDAQKSSNTINDWAESKTNGHIKELVTANSVSNAVILLTNALRFEGTFRYPFEMTTTRDFFTAPRRKSSKEFMEQTGNFYYFFSRHLNAQMIRLPYNGRRFSMFIILPKVINGIYSVTENLHWNVVKNKVWHMDEKSVRVVLPKFKLDIALNLDNVTKGVSLNEIIVAKINVLIKNLISWESLKFLKIQLHFQ